MILILLSPSRLYAQVEEDEYHLCFFEARSFSADLSGEHELKDQDLGVNGRLYYNIRENICFEPEIGDSSYNEGNSNEFNFVIHYIVDLGYFGLSPVGGFNITKEVKSEIEDLGMGIITGVGLHGNIRQLTFFTEYNHAFRLKSSDKIAFGLIYIFSIQYLRYDQIVC